MVCTESLFGVFIIHHRIGEPADVAACYPHFWVHDDAAIEADHADFLAVGAGGRVADHVRPPGVFDVLLQLDAERAVVPEPVDAAVDFRRLEDEPAVLAKFGELRHVDLGHEQNPLRSCWPWSGQLFGTIHNAARLASAKFY